MLVLEPPHGDPSSPVLSRWARASGLGVRPESEAYPEGTTDRDLGERRDRLAEAFREEGSILAPMTRDLAARGLVAILADPDGVILAANGGSAFDDAATRVRLVEGARWSEDVRGTNAIGTALVERRPIGVVGAAHFEARNHGLFCYAHPIADGYGEIVAVLDVTGPLARHDPGLARVVSDAAARVEEALRRLAYLRSGAGTLAAIERLVHRSASATLLVEARGQVSVVNDLARGALGLDASHRITCEQVFGLAFADLARLALAGSDLRFETRATSYRVELNPLGAPGRPFAVVVYLEAAGAAPARPVPPPPSLPRAVHASFSGILGTDEALVRAKAAASRFATTTLPVLLLAETGTGKELFARAIHGASGRAAGPFVAINCGALPSGVLESELFGYAPGAFTGAGRGGTEGKIGAADGGTLFLDEIAEMPDALQAALLRVLDEGGVHYRVGEARPRRSDFRLVCATCRDLPALVERGAFRRDLFFRIHGACVTLPTLRARSDRLALAEGLLSQMPPPLAAIAPGGRRWIEEHGWPGNVRELKSALVHAVAMADGEPLEAEHFPRPLVGIVGEAPQTRAAILDQAIHDAVAAANGNVSEAARRLGVARSTVYRVLRRG